jgi:hypothetical protein
MSEKVADTKMINNVSIWSISSVNPFTFLLYNQISKEIETYIEDECGLIEFVSHSPEKVYKCWDTKQEAQEFISNNKLIKSSKNENPLNQGEPYGY